MIDLQKEAEAYIDACEYAWKMLQEESVMPPQKLFVAPPWWLKPSEAITTKITIDYAEYPSNVIKQKAP